MSFETINVGDLPNDGTGDPVRVAFIKINNNFAQSTSLTSPSGPNGAIQLNLSNTVGNVTTNTFTGSSNLRVVGSNLNLGFNIIPTGTINIGALGNRIGNLYVSNTGFNVGNVSITENNGILSLGNVSVDTLSSGNTSFKSATFTTTDITENVTILSVPIASFNNGKFEINSRVTGTNNSQYAVIDATRNNGSSAVKHTVYGTIFTGSVVTTYDVDVSDGNVRIKVSPLINSPIIHNISYQINN
jgi:hypothetical protein